MTRNSFRSRRTGEEGFVLAVMIVFVVVLMLTGFLVAGMTRTDTQVVNNIQNEKEAFYFAEAGVTEALMRLRQTSSGVTVAVDTGSGTLNVPYEIVPDETSANWRNWRTQITFTMDLAGLAGGVTPTVQSAALQLPYSYENSGPNDEKLTIEWAKDGAGNVRTIGTRRVLQIRSTGRSGAARRTVVVEGLESAGCPLGGICALNRAACGGFMIQGTKTVQITGGMTVNSDCATALDLDNNSTLQVDGGIDVVGEYDGQGTVGPTAPNVAAEEFPDPLEDLSYPWEPGDLPCTEPNQLQITGTGATSIGPTDPSVPAVYCGGIQFGGSGTITLRPGIYVIAGGKLATNGNPTIQMAGSTGVMFFITQHPATGSQASVDLGSLNNVNLAGLTAAGAAATGRSDYQGLILFQARENTNQISIYGNFADGLNGTVYAANAEFFVQDSGGGTKELNLGLIVGNVVVRSNAIFNPPTTPATGGFANSYQAIAWRDWP